MVTVISAASLVNRVMMVNRVTMVNRVILVRDCAQASCRVRRSTGTAGCRTRDGISMG